MRNLIYAAAFALLALIVGIPVLVLVVNTVARVGKLLGMP